MDDLLRKITEFVLFVLPVSALWLDSGVSGSTAILILVSLFGLAVFRNNEVVFDKHEKILLVLFTVFTLYSLASWWWHGLEDSGIKHAGRQLRFILIIPVYFWLRRIESPSAFMRYGIIIGAIISLIAVIYEIQKLGMHRPGNTLNPILFGDIALILGFMAFALKDMEITKPVFLRFLPVIALFSGITASIMSGTRGAWIAIPTLFLVYIALHWRNFDLRSRISITLMVLIFPMIVYLVPATGIESRVNLALNDVDAYFTEQDTSTPLGLRLEAWRAAYYMAVEHPLFGVGFGRFKQESTILVENGTVLENANAFDHPHNDYLYQLSVNGLIGLVLLILMYLYPLYLFYKSVSSSDLEIKALSIAGLYLVIGYMHFSLTETLMVRSTPISFYSFFILALLALISNRRDSLARSK